MVGDAANWAHVASAGALNARCYVATRDESCVAFDLVAELTHLRLATSCNRVGIMLVSSSA